jgi:hypothetical protein
MSTGHSLYVDDALAEKTVKVHVQNQEQKQLYLAENPPIPLTAIEYDDPSESHTMYGTFFFYTTNRSKIAEVSVDEDRFVEVYNWIENNNGETKLRKFLYL